MLTCSLDGSWPAACSAYSSSCSRPTRGLLLPRQELREPVRITLSPPSVCVVQMPVRTSVLGLCLTQCCCTVVRTHPSRPRLRTPPAPGIPGASRPGIPLPQGGWWSDLVICSLLEHGEVTQHWPFDSPSTSMLPPPSTSTSTRPGHPGLDLRARARTTREFTRSRIALAAPHWIP